MLFVWALFAASAFCAVIERIPGASLISQVQQELSPRLSDGTEIIFPSSSEYTNYTERWSEAVATDPAVVVVPATTSDVATTVKFANAIGVSFYAVNRAHGSPVSQLAFQNGIQINMRQLNSIDIADDGQSAVMGGGVYVDEIIRGLDVKGKAAMTGSCGCVGGMGPALGGGYGRYMGYWGLAADNVISFDVVLADGSTTEVSSTSKPDLFWAMRGAGHNFGIVTQFKYNVYDRPSADWYYSLMTFTSDKLEAFFALYNAQNADGRQPKELITTSEFRLNPNVSKTEPVVTYSAYYVGTAAQAQPYLAPFLNLGPVEVTNDTVPYPDLANAVGTGIDNPVCQKGNSAALYPVGLKTYNATANRAVHNLMKQMIAEVPGFNRSMVQFENYPVAKMQSVDPASTSFGHRADNLLASFTFIYAPSSALDALVPKYGRQAQAILDEGEPDRPLNAYVNYAHGGETLEQLYGYEPWRLERLKALKRKYDPQNKFRFYEPLV